jgi:hypothetical protein
LICTVTSGVDLDATQTEGTDTIVGPRQAAFKHHLLLNASIRLLLRDEIGGLGGIGVFQALADRYHLSLTHLGRLTFRVGGAGVHGRSLGAAPQLVPADAQVSH